MRSKTVAVMSAASAAVLVLAARTSQLPAVTLSPQGAGLVGASVTGEQTASPPAVAGPAPGLPRATRRASTLPTAGPHIVLPVRASRPPSPAARVTPPRTAAAATPRSAPATTKPTATPKPAPSKTVTVNGAAANTQYGPVQVQITLRAGHIVSSNAIDYPQQSRQDQEINSRAIPQLNQETVQADSAQIDTVSGATYTSEGYRESLQSALDAAHRAGYR
ncbi:MAG: FMN-binding protein [Mycobacteriales bacterium]